MTIGIYLITCTSTNDTYIGASTNIHIRWQKHIYNLKKNQHHNKPLQNLYNLYGFTNLVFQVLQECTLEQLADSESWHITIYKPTLNRSFRRLGLRSIISNPNRKHERYLRRKAAGKCKTRKLTPEQAKAHHNKMLQRRQENPEVRAEYNRKRQERRRKKRKKLI